MAKRYHQTKKDRMHESMGMKSAPHHAVHHSSRMEGHYEGRNDRRRQEMEDAGMIHEDHSQIANLPQEVMMKPYEMTGPYMPENLDDTIHGIDKQMDYDDSQRKKTFMPKKV